MIVVDTNVIAYLLIAGTFTKDAQALRVSEPEWVAPRLWLDEFLNILATSERNDLMTRAAADQTLALACELMEDCSYDLPAQRILATARRTSCTAYDSQYVCLAEDLGVKLYTYDKRVLTNCPDIAQKPPKTDHCNPEEGASQFD
ncbi:MAG: type II toxin-antitoxin system VapC family toxin [Akkermansiaceae bacterium]